MPKTLYYKLFVGYLLFGLFSFLFIFFVAREMANKALMDSEKERLKTRGSILNEELVLSSNPQITIDNFAKILDSTIWVINEESDIVISSNPDLFDFYKPELYQYLNLENIEYIYDANSINVPISEININGNKGYLMISRPLSIISGEFENLENIAMVSFVVIYLLSLIILIIFTFFVYLPIKQISHAASEFAKGNLKYKVLVVNTDDELGKLAASLNYMASQLRSLEEDQRKFIANISHDFRSPLTSIKGYIEAMKDGTIPPESRDRYLDTVLFETNRLNKLTKSLLTINAWETKEHRLEISDFNIKVEIRHVIETLEVISNKKKILFESNFKTKYLMVSADKEKIEQVLYNLIDNAIKFSDNNSTIYVSVYDKGEKIYVSIKDTGIGISSENIPKIFDRFYKLDSSRGKDKTGTGLGLSIVKEILQYHNENITVVSTEGAGTEFVFSLKKAKRK